MVNFLKQFFKEPKRGLVYVRAIGGGLLNKGNVYEGNYEVIIEEENKEFYKIRYLDDLFQRSEMLPKWVLKKEVKIL